MDQDWGPGEFSVDHAVADVADEVAGEGHVLHDEDAVLGHVERLVDGVVHEDGVHGFHRDVGVGQHGEADAGDGGVCAWAGGSRGRDECQEDGCDGEGDDAFVHGHH